MALGLFCSTRNKRFLLGSESHKEKQIKPHSIDYKGPDTIKTNCPTNISPKIESYFKFRPNTTYYNTQNCLNNLNEVSEKSGVMN